MSRIKDNRSKQASYIYMDFFPSTDATRINYCSYNRKDYPSPQPIPLLCFFHISFFGFLMIINLSKTFRFMLRSFFLEKSCYFCALFVICFATSAPSSGLMISFAAELKQGSEKWLPTLSIKMKFCGKQFFYVFFHFYLQFFF